jgi:predicted permease
MAEELAFHREMAGQPIGNLLQLREEGREAWGWTWLDRLAQDLRFATRLLSRDARFSVGAVLMLALGIGANIAAFRVFDVIFLQTLPIADAERWLRLERSAPGNYASDLPYPAMQALARESRTVERWLALDGAQLQTQTPGDLVRAHFVSTGYIETLGGRLLFGRPLPGEPTEPEAVLSHSFWQRHFGARPSIVGTRVRWNGHPVRIVGVVAPEFTGFTIAVPDAWLPLAQQPLLVTGSKLFTDWSAESDGVDVWVRRAAEHSPAAVQSELTALVGSLRATQPNHIWQDERILTKPGAQAQDAGGRSRGSAPSPNLRDRMLPLFGAVAALSMLLLILTCGNLGALLMARGVAREREIWIRLAIGAAPSRLLRQLLTEGALLASLGTVVGLALGYAVLQLLLQWTDGSTVRLTERNTATSLFAMLLGIVSVLLFALAPALQVLHQRHHSNRWRTVLVTAQVASSCVLLIVSALFVRAFDQATRISPGFEYRNVYSIDPRLAAHGHDSIQARRILTAMRGRIESLRGVRSVSISTTPPLGNRVTTLRWERNGRAATVHLHHVSPTFFATLGIPLVRGRAFGEREAGVIVVGEALARSVWPGRDPLGATFEIGPNQHRVVGIATNTRLLALQNSDVWEVFLPLADEQMANGALLVSGTATPQALLTAASQDSAPIVQSLERRYAERVEDARKSALVVGVLGALALLLACLGIIGVLGYAVSQRTREIGIRVALGANPIHVVMPIARQTIVAVAVGLAIGMGLAAALAGLLRQHLYGIAPLDPTAFVSAALIFSVAALLAARAPLRRALRVSPMEALRMN